MAKNGSHTRTVEWRLFSDATCAGLSALIPIPVVDLLFEGVFRRRMPRTIVRYRDATVNEWVLKRLGRGKPWLSLAGCLMLPFVVVRWVLKRIWRKVIYVLAVIDATEQLSVYWHRAYLLDHAVRRGHLADTGDPWRAADVVDQVMDEADTSPVRGVARSVAGSARRVLWKLMRARRQGADAVTVEQERLLEADWDAVERSLEAAVDRYDELWLAARDEPVG